MQNQFHDKTSRYQINYAEDRILVVIDNMSWGSLVTMKIDAKSSILNKSYKGVLEGQRQFTNMFGIKQTKSEFAQSLLGHLKDMRNEFSMGDESLMLISMLAASILKIDGTNLRTGDIIGIDNLKDKFGVGHLSKKEFLENATSIPGSHSFGN